MATSISYHLDRREERKGGYPIRILLSHKGVSDRVPILDKRVRSSDSYWNPKQTYIRITHPNYGYVDAKLKAAYEIGQATLKANQSVLPKLSLLEVKKLLKSAINEGLPGASSVQEVPVISEYEGNALGNSSLRFLDWTMTLYRRWGAEGRWGTARNKLISARALISFYGSQDLRLNQINRDLLQGFREWHIGKAKPGDEDDKVSKQNGAFNYLKEIRVILNLAEEEEKMAGFQNPFSQSIPKKKRFRLGQTTRKSRALPISVISDLKKLYREEVVNGYAVLKGSRRWEAVAETLFIWEASAMNLKDFVKVKVGDIVHDVYVYNRSKTGSEVRVKVSPLMREIINYFSQGKSHKDYLFRYGWDPSERGHTRYRRQVSKFNKFLKEVCWAMGYEFNVTSYAIRHTFATQLNRNGISLRDIGVAMGHSSLITTINYVGKSDSEVVADRVSELLQSLEIGVMDDPARKAKTQASFQAAQELGITFSMHAQKCPECQQNFLSESELLKHVQEHMQHGEWREEEYGPWRSENIQRERVVAELTTLLRAA